MVTNVEDVGKAFHVGWTTITINFRGYVAKATEAGSYALLPEGRAARVKILEEYYAQIAKATEGMSEKTIDTALSSLLTVQNNLQLAWA